MENSNSRIAGLDIARALAIFGMVIENYITSLHPFYDSPENSLIWYADILHFFAIYMILGLFLVNLKSKKTFYAAILITFAFPLFYALFDYYADWNMDKLEYLAPWTISGTFKHIFFNGFHSVFPWFGFFAFGIWLGKAAIFSPQIMKKLTFLSIFTILTIISLKILFDFPLYIDSEETANSLFALTNIGFFPPMPLYVLLSASVAFLVIDFCIWIKKNAIISTVCAPFSSVGQMSLSIYLAHIYLGLGILEAFGFAAPLDFSFVFIFSFAVIITSTIFSHLWLKMFKYGPFEWLMRKLTN